MFCYEFDSDHKLTITFGSDTNFEYGVSTSIGYGVSNSLSNTVYSSQQISIAYPLPLDTAYRLSETEAEILVLTYWLFNYFSNDDLYDLSSVEAKFPAIVINDAFAPQDALQCESQVSTPFNDEIDFRISIDESDDEDYTIIYDKNSFSYKMIYVNNLKTDSEKENEKVIPSIPSPEPTVSYFDDLDYFKDFGNEFPAIIYNDALTSKSDFLTEPTLKPQHIDEFNLKDEKSFFECDEEEQNVLCFNDLFPLK
ncbi:hypothetical protein Tco_0222696 [Tanacetum coccineum]